MIKIEIPNDAVVMREFGLALQRIADGTQVNHTGSNVAPTLSAQIIEPEVVETTEPAIQLPWDDRIHSSNKTKNQDGSWKMRKKPKDMGSDEWQQYVDKVQQELVTLMSIPVEEDLTPPPPPVEQVEVAPKQEDLTPPPPAPAEQVEPVNAGITQGDVEDVKTFVELVKRFAKIAGGDMEKSAKLKAAVAEKYGVEFQTLAKKPELIPQVAKFMGSVEV